MSTSILTSLGLVFKKVTGIKDISMLRKDIHKRLGMLVYHQKYSADDVVDVMCSMGMSKGSVVCIHAAMKEFYNYEGTAEELIQKIQAVITEEGTLLMPAYPDPELQRDTQCIFHPQTDKTFAGHLAETFRNLPGVRRSINVQHSVCAWGKHAEWLTKDHSKCKNCWDEDSPWYRMTTLQALVFTLGLGPHYIGTFDHCVEGLLYLEYPYWRQFFTVQKTYRYMDEQGKIKTYTCIEGHLERRTHEQTLIRYFSPDIYKKYKLSNLLIKVFYSKPCLDKMLQLGRQGITMYYIPSTKGYQFEEAIR
ncbi:AAC(3) family N-acetyltransferase [Prevotella sp. KH2C16]|uniref:AAC(3) family N-acetyltransferase n=1 Tax=Prevotella sp. KH2C16 TaxID=1855325 RepID=UPI000B814500|nr:AAC(3) family N-acetyltransferase [Prevotella sp. KH2C16]